MNFGEFQKNQRQVKNLSIYQISKQTGISQSQLANYENGKNSPTLKNADLICKALKTKFVIGR